MFLKILQYLKDFERLKVQKFEERYWFVDKKVESVMQNVVNICDTDKIFKFTVWLRIIVQAYAWIYSKLGIGLQFTGIQRD